MGIQKETNGGPASKSSPVLQTATPLGDSDDPKSQEILAFRRNPEEWSRRKYSEINAVRVYCSHTCQAFIDLIHKSRIQKVSDFDLVYGRKAMSSGLSHQNLASAIYSVLWSPSRGFCSACVRRWPISRSRAGFHIVSFAMFIHSRSFANSSVSSFHTVSRFLSYVMCMTMLMQSANVSGRDRLC